MSTNERRDRTLEYDGQLRTGPEALEVPLSVYVGESGTGARLEVEAEIVAARNRSIRIDGLGPPKVRTLRDALDSVNDHAA